MMKLMPLPLLSILALCCLWSFKIEAATVRGIVKDKFIAIDVGSDSGFNQKTRVCFFDKQTRIACGVVVQAKPKRAFVRVSPDNLKKIKKGMAVKLFDGGTAVSAGTSTSSEMPESSSDQKKTTGLNGASNLKLAYILTPKTPATYHAVSYFAPFDADGTPLRLETLWDRDRDIITSVLGFGLELGLGVGSSKLTVGGRMRLYKGTTVKSFYDDNLTNYAETRMSGSAFGGWADFYYLSINYGKLSIDIGNGLDFDLSQIAMTMEKKSDINPITNKLVDYKSSLTVLSLRTNLLFNLFFDPLGLQFGTFFTFPLSSSGSPTVSFDDPQADSLLGVTGSEDLIDAIDHRAARFGIELFFSAYYAF